MPRKMCQLRLSRNSTKFYVLARFRETIPTVKSVLSSDIQRINFGFLTEITILEPKLRFCHFSRNWNFSGLTIKVGFLLYLLLSSLLLYFSILTVALFLVSLLDAHLATFLYLSEDPYVIGET